MSFPDAEKSKADRPLNINRRDLLLGGTVLAAASAAIASGAPGPARAQEQPAAGGPKRKRGARGTGGARMDSAQVAKSRHRRCRWFRVSRRASLSPMRVRV